MNKTLHIILCAALSTFILACTPTSQQQMNLDTTNDSTLATNHASVTDKVSSIEIDWVSGPIRLIPTDDSAISITEQAAIELNSDNSMQYQITPLGELNIAFCKDDYHANGHKDWQKSLTVLIPRQLMLDEIEINGVGGMIEIDSILCDELSIDGVNFNTTAHFDRLPSKIDCDGVSQELHLYAPEGSRIFAEADGVHAKVINEAHCTKQQAQCRIKADGVNVKVEVRKDK